MKMGRDSGVYVPSSIVLRSRCDASGAVVDGDELELVEVLGVVGVAEIAEGVAVAVDALDEEVVVLAREIVGAAGPCLADDLLSEVVEGARVGAWTVEPDLVVGPCAD